MLCEKCQKVAANVHLTQVVDGEVRKLHLCEACAKEAGMDLQGAMSITDILLGMGGEGAPDLAEVSADVERSCPRCHLRKSDFKKTGQLGCPGCYEAFAEDLKPLLKAIHRGERHLGKVPEREGARVRMTAELATLQKELKEAVAAERYEEAARLRDRIQDCLAVARQEEKPES